ncbi:aldehyde ferredoxin oxidoreductase [Archaeoglobales archaeon]|nr:MAG: aldehyde ferredoxin oxidoreductase [Archaeoglobales archaeon]
MSFTGNVLTIDLKNQSFEEMEIEEGLYARYTGIVGVAYHFAEEFVKSNEDFVILAAGVLTNTRLPGATKVLAITKNPLNGTFGLAVGGGAFARDMKKAGYDLIILRDFSDKPIYLVVDDKEIKIEDASKLWGRDIVETTDYLKEKYRGSVLSIGKAGENEVPIALTLIDAIHHLGKGGLGAVLGAKRVKAIVVSGKKEAKIAEKEKFEKERKELIKRMRGDQVTKQYRDIGIMAVWDLWWKLGYLNYKNKSIAVGKEILDEFGVEKYKEKIKRSSIGCSPCLSPCKSLLEVEIDGEKLKTKVSLYLGVAYEFGVKCGIKRAEEAVKCHDYANKLGIDAMIFAEIFDALATFFDEAKIFEDEIGFPIKRDAETVLKLLEMTANKEGLGEYIGIGFKGLEERFGKWVRREVVNIKNMEIIFDPRISFGSESFGLLTNPRGGQEGPVTITVIPGRKEGSLRRYMERIGASKELIEKTFENGFNSALYTLAAENWLWVLNGQGICRRESITRSLDINVVSRLFSYATGIEADAEKMVDGAAKAFTIARKLNCMQGYSKKDDLPPSRLFEPLKVGDEYKVWRDYLTGGELGMDRIEEMLEEYYEWRGWSKDGCP